VTSPMIGVWGVIYLFISEHKIQGKNYDNKKKISIELHGGHKT